MTGNKDYFAQIDEFGNLEVIMGNNTRVEVCGLDIVFVGCKIDRKLIHNVTYVPNIVQNLLSLV